jgi:hypothetical protein
MSNIEQLLSLQINLDLSICEKIFGAGLGKHLYDKFVSCDRNLLSFYSRLDAQNRKKLADFTNPDSK